MTESNKLEFKEKLPDNLEREVVAFLNSEGGVIYIGLNNEGTPVGVDHIDETQRKISDRIKNNISPTTLGLYDVSIEEIEGVEVIKIYLSSGNERPYYWKQKGMSQAGCFIRKGSSTIPMPDDIIIDLFSKRTRNSIRKIESPRNDLSFAQLKIYYQEKGYELNSKFKESLELLTSEGKLNYIAYLLADENGTSMKVAKYSGKDKYDLIENQEFGYCSLIKSTLNILNKFEIENVTKTKITSKERIETNLVDKVALREAIINAVVHTDWTEEVPPLFEIFEDKFVITSFGSLIPGMTKEELFSCCSRPRNRELMRIFKDLELVEQLGSGMTRILAKYKKSIFEFTGNFIKITFKFDGSDLLKKVTNKTLNNQQIILNYIKENGQASKKELSCILSLSSSGTLKCINSLINGGFIYKEGNNKNIIYKLKK